MLLRLLLIAVLALPLPGVAQDQKKGDAGESAQQSSKALFKLDYQVIELEDGRRMDSHNYTMLGSPNDTARFRIGSRVPVKTSTKPDIEQWSYMDVGMNIDARITEPGEDSVRVATTMDLSTIVISGGLNDTAKIAAQPVLRNLHAQDLSTLAPGKQATLFHLDEPNSKRAFQVLCTITKVR